MEVFNAYVLTSLSVDSNGDVVSRNVGLTFNLHEAEAHRDADVANGFETFGIAAHWREDGEQSKLVEAMREFRAMVRQWQEEALR